MRRIWPFRHFGLKLLSLALGVLLWMVVSGEETVERGLRIPLELQQVPAGIELLGDVPATVDVRVRGASGALSRIGPGDVVAVLDLHSAQSGRRLFPLTPDQVRIPFGVEVMQVMPSTIAMTFETSSTRQVPVVPAVDGRPAPGFVVGALTADPGSVEIVGPDSVVKRATEVLTEPVSVGGARESVHATVILGVEDPSLRLTTARSANVTVEIVPAPLERTLRGRPVHLRNVGPNLNAQAMPAAVDIGLRGSRDTLTRLTPDDVAAYIDLKGLGAGQYTLSVHADALKDAGVTRIEPDSVQVVITSGKP
jgi:YbbR domain-containing protein